MLCRVREREGDRGGVGGELEEGKSKEMGERGEEGESFEGDERGAEDQLVVYRVQDSERDRETERKERVRER